MSAKTNCVNNKKSLRDGNNFKRNNTGQGGTRKNNPNDGQINGGCYRRPNQGGITYINQSKYIIRLKGQNKYLSVAIFKYGKV